MFSVHLAEFGGAPLSRTRLSTMEEIDRLLSTIELDEYTIKEPKKHLSLEVLAVATYEKPRTVASAPRT